MAGFQCPYCSMIMPISDDTFSSQTPGFNSTRVNSWFSNHKPTVTSSLQIDFYKCPNCGEYSIMAKGLGAAVEDVNNIHIRPTSLAKKFPEYIPKSIRQDYEESYAIVELSPKASATLSRRCLQGMIRDFWGITKSRLIDEINALQDIIPSAQWRVIDGVRRIGNIGAHMEKDINSIVDIEPDEAHKLLKLIEHLLEQWYINRNEQELLYADIIGIDENKQAERKKN
jgi:hypothetical protein